MGKPRESQKPSGVGAKLFKQSCRGVKNIKSRTTLTTTMVLQAESCAKYDDWAHPVSSGPLEKDVPHNIEQYSNAMSTNEIETKMAYDHASKNAAASTEAQTYFRKAFADESRHKDWMDAAAAA